MQKLTKKSAVIVFLVFACGYFLSTLIRAVTATLSPVLTKEFDLTSSDLGLLAGGYFFGFAMMQLPLGKLLDRFGPKNVILCFLTLAVFGCVWFSLANSFVELLAARVLCGVGVSACLMSALTGYRRWFESGILIRANSWMLMIGSLGMVTATLPVQWLMPVLGWRPLFWGLAGMVIIAMVLIVLHVPKWEVLEIKKEKGAVVDRGYKEVWGNPFFRRVVPIGFVCYGGFLAMQTLWATPWMIRVGGYSPMEAAQSMFAINVGTLISFWAWGAMIPWLERHGYGVIYLLKRGLFVTLVLLAIIIGIGDKYPSWIATLWVLYCMACTTVSLAQPAVGLAFPETLVGRGLSAYNLVIFFGIFAVQWGVGLCIDLFGWMGLSVIAAFKSSMLVYFVLAVASYIYMLQTKTSTDRVQK